MYKNEFRKIFTFTPIWIFIILALLLNISLSLSFYGEDYFNEVSEIGKKNGTKIDQKLIENVEKLDLSEYKYKNEILEMLKNTKPIFKGYNVETNLKDYYLGQINGSDLAVKLMGKKYDLVKNRLDKLANKEADMDLYAGDITTDSHQFLMGNLLRTISGETCILSIMIMIFLLGYEKNMATEMYFFATKTGRDINKIKIRVGLASSVLIHFGITAISLAFYFMKFDYSGIWSSSVSSQFNTIRDIFLIKPFITWADFSVFEYILANISLSFALVIIAALFSTIFALSMKNTYIAGVSSFLCMGVGISLPIIFSSKKFWIAYFISALQPLAIWLSQPLWFTEAGLNGLFPWFEIKGLIISLIIIIIIARIVLKKSYRKDLV